VHARLTLLVFGRHPAFAVPTLLLPTLFFALFGLPDRRVPHRVITASFAAYSVLTVVFFQFGVGIAGERESAWESYLRTLPVHVRARFGGRVAAAVAFAAVGCGLLLAAAAATGYAGMTSIEWARFVLALAAGAIPLALLGIALGYWVPAKAALPVANVLYLLIAYGGGLWTGPRLPAPAAAVSPARGATAATKVAASVSTPNAAGARSPPVSPGADWPGCRCGARPQRRARPGRPRGCRGRAA
jgi:ABC-2 type transport system permease protein